MVAPLFRSANDRRTRVQIPGRRSAVRGSPGPGDDRARPISGRAPAVIFEGLAAMLREAERILDDPYILAGG